MDMEFLNEIFVKYWKELIVAIMLSLTMPFIRRYIRKIRAKLKDFAVSNSELRKALANEQSTRQEAERKYQIEAEEKLKAQKEAESLRSALEAEQKEAESLRVMLNSKTSQPKGIFSIFSRSKDDEELQKAQDEISRLQAELNEERKARQEAERTNYKAEAESLRYKLRTAQQKLKAIEDAKPAPNSITAKLTELMKAFDVFPYPNHNKMDFLERDVLEHLLNLFPPQGDILRMKVIYAIYRYIDSKGYGYSYYSDEPITRKCMVLYSLVIIAEGIAEKRISVDDKKKLTWKTVSGLIDKLNEEYFKEYPEAYESDDYDKKSAKNMAGSAFGQFLPELILDDKEFINELLKAVKK